MNRYALLAPVVAMAAVCFACTQPSAPPPPPPTPVSVASCTFTATNVKVLLPNYFPDPGSASYSTPGSNLASGAGTSLSAQMVNDLNAALANAPASVQNDICALLQSSGIFIDTSSCQGGTINPCTDNGHLPFAVSWGYRSWNRKDAGSMYIAIPASIWPNQNTTAIAFSQYEQNSIQYFATQADTLWGTASSNSLSLPTVNAIIYNNSASGSWPTVLAALSHELGHVKFNYTIHHKMNHGDDTDFSPLTKCPIKISNFLIIDFDFFSGWSYNGTEKNLVPKQYWRHLGRQDNEGSRNRVDHSASPKLADFTNSTNPNGLLYTLYSDVSLPWASFWGSWSPDEDFVETYVLNALKAGVTSYPITIGGNSYDVMNGLASKPNLSKKLRCIDQLPMISSS